MTEGFQCMLINFSLHTAAVDRSVICYALLRILSCNRAGQLAVDGARRHGGLKLKRGGAEQDSFSLKRAVHFRKAAVHARLIHQPAQDDVRA